MCFETTKYQRAKIAKEDIPCWKTVMRKCKGGYANSFFHIIGVKLFYNPGVLQPRVRIKKESDWYGDYEIRVGYHSYTCKDTALLCMDRGEVVRKFVIPKGTRYFHNVEAKEYVSETIIMK